MLFYLRGRGERQGRAVPDAGVLLKQVVMEGIFSGEIMRREPIVVEG